MERDRDRARSPEEPAAGKEPAAAVPHAHAQILRLQQSAGNAAVSQLLRAPAAATPVNGVKVNHPKVSVPPDAALDLKATADPANAGGTLTFGIATDGAALDAATKADGTTGKITLSAAQAGGRVKATLKQRIDGEDGAFTESTSEQPLQLIEDPTGISSTSESAAGNDTTYQGDFTHTFKPGPGGAAGLELARVNERFTGGLIKDTMSKSHDLKTPFGQFTLNVNDPASTTAGWDLDSSGTMASSDHVSVAKSFIDARPFVVNASKPAATGLPQGWEVTQNFHPLRFPGRTWGATAVASTPHTRTLRDKGGKLEVAVGAGTKEVAEDYAGPAVFRGAKASQSTIEASTAAAAQSVTITVDGYGKDAAASYKIEGPDLGCKVDSSGTLTIGTTPGTVKVRAGDAKFVNYDDVSVTITPPKVADAKPTADLGEGAPAMAAPPAE
jgi:hypothetical protein